MIHDSIILFPSHICRLETRSSGVRLSVNMTPPSALFYTTPGLFKFFLFEVSKCRDVRKSSSPSAASAPQAPRHKWSRVDPQKNDFC